ncbi:extracellular solute-binding protein [Streptomyces sp. YIM 98790]|uniref:extracellular solute-binding protein n=1 Tax=Streptomyces sp. YIM 98790 TaxID=2689077 RepID=UPI001FB7703E|nr:extracellular solute-binding protein [Streptomyces sp. YIM 98790]
MTYPSRIIRATALTCATALLTGCSLLGSDEDETTVLEVWMMNHSAGEDFVQQVVDDFEARHRDVEVRVTFQEWVGIGDKVNEALTTGEGPDVIEVGNTQVAQYVNTGGVKDLTNQVVDLDGDYWVPGLAEPGKVYGHQFGIPFYAANRVVIYRKDLFQEAGIEEPPEDREEWLEITRRLDEVPGRQGIYLPGQNWYVLAGFIWDEGGDLAVESGGRWTGALHTPEAAAGMAFYAELQALGDGPVDTDEANPPHEEVFASGEVAQIISTPGSAQAITDLNPELEDKLGFFPVPGKEAGEPGAVFTGGSNLIITEESAEPLLAYEFVKLITGDTWQTELARSRSFVPNRTTLADAVRDDPGTAAMVAGAVNGRATPQSPRWGQVESDNPIKTYQTAVLTGADPLAAGEEASEVITRLLAYTPSG